ncbi:MAG: ATP-binding protein [Methanomassiliicoccales archaeon]|nr:ATP-binding protein [Methanomassiliicoccales archaeon]
MILTVASGKGGTGKTSVACALALSLDRPFTFLDCDVEGANAHIFLHPVFDRQEEVTVAHPVIDAGKCDLCGKCVEACQFGAMLKIGGKIRLMANLCHGCRVCALVCPKDAISMSARPVGFVRYGKAGKISFVNGDLTVGEALSVPIIKKIKETKDDLVIIDCPPGASCPAVETIDGSDVVLLVTEPTPFGRHDLKAMITVCDRLDVPCGVVINRSSGDDSIIEDLCRETGVPVLLRIPFDRKVAEHYARGCTMLDALPDMRSVMTDLYEKIKELCR